MSNERLQQIESLLINTSLKWLLDIKFFIIAGGKTGSSTLSASFINGLHSHGTCELWCVYPYLRSQNITLKDLIDYSYYKQKKKPLLISTYREPLSRTISSFFENINTYVDLRKINNLGLMELIYFFNKNYLLNLENYHPFLDVNDFGNLNILNTPFDKNKGYQYYENDKVRALILRFDKINEWDTIIKTHLDDIERNYYNFRIDNLSKNKWYYNLYCQFQQNYFVKSDTLDQKFKLHENLMNYFYNSTDIQTIKNSWIKYVNKFSSCKIPDDFNWKIYLAYNGDLPYNNELDCLHHWVIRGHGENRIYNINIPPKFKWKEYLQLNPDLPANGINDENKAIHHWIFNGYKEKRKYCIQ